MAHVVGVPKRDPCRKCELPVFLAERLTVGKKVYHRTCLKCARCGSQLTPGSFYETEVDDEYCCETCPDEEDVDNIGGEVASTSNVQLRQTAATEALTPSATTSSTQLKTVRSSIADRLAFFEQSKSADNNTIVAAAGSKLLQKSVSDEEKTKSLQRMEAKATTTTPYKMNSAFSSFLNDTVDGDAEPQADDGSLGTTSTGSKSATHGMQTTDTEDDATDNDDDLSLDSAPPEMPKTLPPSEMLQAQAPTTPTPSKRFTATAQLQLDVDADAVAEQTTPAVATTNATKATSAADVNNATPTKKISAIQLNLTPSSTTLTNDNANNNEQSATIAAGVEKSTTHKSVAFNIDLSSTNDNDNEDCITKDKTAADASTITAAKQQQTAKNDNDDNDDDVPMEIEQREIETKIVTSSAKLPTVDAEMANDDNVELREKSLPAAPAQTQQEAAAEDVATTQRLSVVRARLQQFEVIANNKNNNENATPTNTPSNTTIKLNENLSDAPNSAIPTTPITITPATQETKTVEKPTEQSNSENATPAVENEVKPEDKSKAIEIVVEETMTTETEKEKQSLNEVPLEMKTKANVSDDNNAVDNKLVAAVEDKENKENVVLEKTKADSANAIKTDSNVINEDYPEDLNPFKSDDEDDTENKENQPQSSASAQPRSTILRKHNSTNPFDSSDDEIELEKSSATTPNSTASAGKVPPPRPPPPRLSRNPFGEDASSNDDAEHFSRNSSQSSSMTKKTPVPTPRTNISQSQNPTPEPTPRLSNKITPQARTAAQYALDNSSEHYGSANSLSTATPQSLYRNSDARGSNNSLTSSSGGTMRSRKMRRAPLPPVGTPATVKELFPSTETINSSSKASTPSSSTVGTPKMGRKKRLAPAPPKPARLDPSLLPQLALAHETNAATLPKNSLNYPLQSESDSKLSDEEKALLEGKTLHSQRDVTNALADDISRRSSRRLIPLDASLLADAADDAESKCDDLKQQQHQQQQFGAEEEETNVVYRRMLIPPNIDTPTHDTNPLIEELHAYNSSTHDRQLEKLKDNKEAQNRNRQSQISASSGAEDSDPTLLYNKSAHGKWKRRKGPAPALPIPPRKVLQMLPLQEIRHELEIIEVQQQGLEKQGVILEKMIRDRCEGQNGEPLNSSGNAIASEDVSDGNKSATITETVQNSKEVEDLILQLFELVNEKNELFRRQAELMYLRRQHRLEQEQADLEYEIRVLMAQPERNKTDTDKAREEALIARLVEVVQLRNEVVECLEMDRLREAEEDLSIKQRLELHTANREGRNDECTKSSTKLSKKEKKKQKEAKKLGKSKKLDADKDADETELNEDRQRAKKKKQFKLLNFKAI